MSGCVRVYYWLCGCFDIRHVSSGCVGVVESQYVDIWSLSVWLCMEILCLEGHIQSGITKSD